MHGIQHGQKPVWWLHNPPLQYCMNRLPPWRSLGEHFLWFKKITFYFIAFFSFLTQAKFPPQQGLMNIQRLSHTFQVFWVGMANTMLTGWRFKKLSVSNLIRYVYEGNCLLSKTHLCLNVCWYSCTSPCPLSSCALGMVYACWFRGRCTPWPDRSRWCGWCSASCSSSVQSGSSLAWRHGRWGVYYVHILFCEAVGRLMMKRKWG